MRMEWGLWGVVWAARRSRARVGEQSIDDSILRLCESAVVAEQLGGLELLLELTQRDVDVNARAAIAALEEVCYVLGKDKTYEDMKARLEAPRGDDAEGGGLEEEPQASRRGFGVGEGARDFDEEEREALRGG